MQKPQSDCQTQSETSGWNSYDRDAWSGRALVWMRREPHPAAQLSVREEYFFPGLGWGGSLCQALPYISVLILSHIFFRFTDIPEYARNIEMPPKSTEKPLWPHIRQNESTFCAFSPHPFPCCGQVPIFC